MSWALDWFGLPADAAERDVKRAYATRLKSTRPDEQPEQFQELHAMYEAALAWCRMPEAMRAQLESEVDTDFAAEVDAEIEAALDEAAAKHDEAPPPAHTETYDATALLDHVFDCGARDDAPGLVAWLAADEALWSLTLKHRVADWLLGRLLEDTPPIGPAAFDALLAFFDIAPHHHAVDGYELVRLRERATLRWRLLPENAAALDVATSTRTRGRPGIARLMLRQLARPFSPWQAIAMSLVPCLPSKLRAFLLALDNGNLDLPPPIDARQVAYWEKAGDRTRMSWPRAFTGLGRVLACQLLVLPMLLLGAVPLADWPTTLAWTTGGFAVAWGGIVLANTGWRRKDGSQVPVIWILWLVLLLIKVIALAMP